MKVLVTEEHFALVTNVFEVIQEMRKNERNTF
jgi:hypothetical protein